MTDDDIPINADEPLVIFGDGDAWQNTGACRWMHRKPMMRVDSATNVHTFDFGAPGGVVEIATKDDLRDQVFALGPVLQQAWRNISTGAVEWRDVPTAEGEA